MNTPKKDRRFSGAIVDGRCRVEAWIGVTFEDGRSFQQYQFNAFLDEEYEGGVVLTRGVVQQCWPLYAETVVMEPDTKLKAHVQLGVLGQIAFWTTVPVELTEDPRHPVVIGHEFLSRGSLELDKRMGKWTWTVKADQSRTA